MLRVSWLALVGCALACGPEVATSASDASSSSGATGSSGTAVTSAEVTSASPSSADSSSASTPGSSSETGRPETCTPGTFVGLYTVGFESFEFESCETGESWAFAAGGNPTCPEKLWVTVEGELCGPEGPLGGYLLYGDVVAGPCEASCGETPEPDACASFEELCPLSECDLTVQDCPRGERCAPVGIDGAPPWRGSSCVFIDEPIQPVGASCSATSLWHDDCEALAFCVAGGDGAGTCAALCSPADGAACELGTCWPCDFGDEPPLLGVCGVDEVAC